MSAGLASLPADVRELLAGASDEQLAGLAASGDPVASAAAFAEAGRRDAGQLRVRKRAERREAARARRAAVDAAWRDAAYAEYVQAEAATRGCMLAPGAPARDPFPVLWTCCDRDFGRWASEEMKRWREFDAGSFTRRADYFRQAYRPHAGEYPWHEAGPGGGDPGGLSVFTPAAQEPTPVAEPAPERGTPGGTGEDAPPAGPADSGAPERAARRAERTRAGEAMAGRIAAYAPGAAAGRVTLPPPAAAVPAGLRRERGHPGSTGSALAVPAPGLLITPPASAIIAPGAAPPAEPLDGEVLWNLLRRYLGRYVAFRTKAEMDLVIAWIFHAMARDRDNTQMGQLIWRASPRLLLTSRARGSGKSTVLDLIAILTQSRRGKIPRITPAKIAKVTGKYYETVLLDEARSIFGTGNRHIELQGCLLAGYTRRSSYEVANVSLSLFGAVAYAAKEDLITESRGGTGEDAGPLGDLLDRSLKVLQPPPLRPMHEVDEQAEEDGELIAQALVDWTNAWRRELRAAARALADEDFEAANAIYEAGGSTGNLRLVQITRPLRACARVASPQIEAHLNAALAELTEGTASAEARGGLDELQRRAAAWGDPFADDEPGRVVMAPPDDEAGWGGDE